VRIALALKGLEVEHVPVHLVKEGGQQHQDGYGRKNPMHQVPSLELGDGTVLVQSMAILEYLEETHPTPAILPSEPLARARARAMAEMINSGVQPLQNLTVLQHVKNDLGGSAQDWGRRFIGRGMAALETFAARVPGSFLVGDAPTMADILLIPQLYNCRRFGIEVAEFPRLSRAELACSSIEAFKQAHPDMQPDAEAQE